MTNFQWPDADEIHLYNDFTSYSFFRELKRNSPREDLTAHIIFTEDSFASPYPLLSRTYLVSSDNKAFWSRMELLTKCQDLRDQRGLRQEKRRPTASH